MAKFEMTSVEQHKMVAALEEFEGRMSRDEHELFEMFRKRDHDDEDLDLISKRQLKDLFDKYAVRKVTKENPLDALFRK